MTCEHQVPLGDMQVWVGETTPPAYSCAFCEIKRLEAIVERLQPIYEAAKQLHGGQCETYGFCEQCFDRCGDCSPPHWHRDDCPGNGAEERLETAVKDAMRKEHG